MVKHHVGKWVVTCRDDGRVVIANEHVSNVYDALSLANTDGSFTVGTRIDAYDDVIVTRYELVHIRNVVIDEYFTN
jgi:hypothetical protein